MTSEFETVTPAQVREGKTIHFDGSAQNFCLASIAISLKRIADALESGTTGPPVSDDVEIEDCPE